MTHSIARSLYLASVLASCFSCATAPKAIAPIADPKPPLASFTPEGALLRLKQVEKPRYHARLDLAGNPDQYSVQAEVRFDLRPEARGLGQPVMLDLEGAREVAIQINGQTAVQDAYDGHEIRLPLDQLKSKGNRVSVSFVHSFVNLTEDAMHSLGFLKYTDPVDRGLILYTNFEPSGARQVFPCFDQPSLKGTIAMDVLAPREWQIVANTRESAVEDLPRGQKLWHFPETRHPAPTYVFHVSAGKMVEWSAPEKVNGVPLRLFARPSVAAKIDGETWLADTAAGLAYLNKTFGKPYAFEKLDQVILPAFPGSMENLAAIGVGEMLASGPHPGAAERAFRAQFLFHELTHHWFGNLVTEKWWSDLPLIEGFCDLYNLRAIDETLKYKHLDAQRQIFYTRAIVSELAPQSLTLIREVPDARSVDAFLSPLLLIKSSAALADFEKQIGSKAFLKLVRDYVRKFAFKNADAKDFYRLATEELHQDFEPWRKSWYEEMHLKHTPLAIACESGQDLEACPALHFIDSSALGYTAPELNDPQLALVVRSVSRFNDPYERMIAWLALWIAVHENRLTPSAFLSAVNRELPAENQPEVAMRTIFLASHAGSPTVAPGAIQMLPESEQVHAKEILISEVRARLASPDASGDLLATLQRSLVGLK